MLDKQVALVVQAFVQHDAEPAAPAHAPLVQVFAEDSYTHACSSCEQVANTDVLAQVLPITWQTGSTLHVHLAVPIGPEQVCRGPQATAALHFPLVHVCTLVPLAEHCVALS